MELSNAVWGFSASENAIYAKSPQNGLPVKKIILNLELPDNISDLTKSSNTIYLLQNSTLFSINLYKEYPKPHGLKLGTYYGIISLSNDIIILGHTSLKFNTTSKLCRKINLDLLDIRIICKCTSPSNELYLLVNTLNNSHNSILYKYVYSLDKVTVVHLDYKIPVSSSACSVLHDNSIILFGGKYEINRSSRECFQISLETMKLEAKNSLLAVSIFQSSSAIEKCDRISVLDISGNLHLYSFQQNKWRMFSDRAWNKRKNLLWAWKISQLYSSCMNFYKLPVSIVRKMLREFYN